MTDFKNYCDIGHLLIGWNEDRDCPVCELLEKNTKNKENEILKAYLQSKKFREEIVDWNDNGEEIKVKVNFNTVLTYDRKKFLEDVLKEVEEMEKINFTLGSNK
jgi:hypothetical protein